MGCAGGGLCAANQAHVRAQQQKQQADCTSANTCVPLEIKVPMRGPYALPRGGTQVMLVYASGQCMEQRSCGCSQLWHSAPPGMAVGCCELRLKSTPRYRLECICFPTPGRSLPYGSGLGLSRCLGPGECLHSFIQTHVCACVLCVCVCVLRVCASVCVLCVCVCTGWPLLYLPSGCPVRRT